VEVDRKLLELRAHRAQLLFDLLVSHPRHQTQPLLICTPSLIAHRELRNIVNLMTAAAAGDQVLRSPVSNKPVIEFDGRTQV
jgi:hypothetical protein